ncbi:MAG: Lrp/AsnC family transcriptional regulator [Proteobacteria bacterium]|nr:Lrp/AsnC family transcriptional regulator [Pseudomonadota bacterium]
MSERGLDEADLRILDALQEDGRLSNVELAERVHLSPSPCLRRVQRLEEEGVTLGYRAALDRPRIGLGLTVYVEITVVGHSRENADRVGKALVALPEVVFCTMISGEADFLAEIAVADLAAYERLLSAHLLTMPMVGGIRSNFALRIIKANGALPLSRSGSRPGPLSGGAGRACA